MKFTQLTDKLNYPAKIKGKLSTLHAAIITYVISDYKNTRAYKSRVIDLLNRVSYFIITGDSLPGNWSADSPFDNLPAVDKSDFDGVLGNLLLNVSTVNWDVEEAETAGIPKTKPVNKPAKASAPKPNSYAGHNTALTPKENLYVRPPVYPQIDTARPWLYQSAGGTDYVIYRSLPLIPTNQAEISATTEADTMTAKDLMNLYPNWFVKTRAAVMYSAYEGLTLDPDLGLVLPIEGFTAKQVRDNIIKYPHLFQLSREIDGKLISFYSQIEINGELHNINEVWDTLPDSKKMPHNSEFAKEYVVRRYLLERDVKGIKHKYPMFGALDPFLTLFTAPNDYVRFGYTDTLDIAKQCANARVNYKRSRNPVLRALRTSGRCVSKDCIFSPHCTEYTCNMACPKLCETSYLLERNGITMSNPVFNVSAKDMTAAQSMLKSAEGRLGVVISDNTIATGTLLTYCAICERWKGNRLHCCVYNLKFSNHIDALQKSWSSKRIPESLEYEQIFMDVADVLIVTNIDYVQFNDFPSQTLLNLIHNRMSKGLTTIVVSPKIHTLVGDKLFFSRLKTMLEGAVINK